jgi:hypothetical protein
LLALGYGIGSVGAYLLTIPLPSIRSVSLDLGWWVSGAALLVLATAFLLQRAAMG